MTFLHAACLVALIGTAETMFAEGGNYEPLKAYGTGSLGSGRFSYIDDENSKHEVNSRMVGFGFLISSVAKNKDRQFSFDLVGSYAKELTETRRDQLKGGEDESGGEGIREFHLSSGEFQVCGKYYVWLCLPVYGHLQFHLKMRSGKEADPSPLLYGMLVIEENLRSLRFKLIQTEYFFLGISYAVRGNTDYGSNSGQDQIGHMNMTNVDLGFSF